ncbi:FG-GAP-like repeat-containing protein [Streptomyces sp. NPDC005318]|uniref:FG-GAP-like repeat-containing protein n=1 Tax=Streptomyces sp. NPDC005318 TaxID=3157031 RepID=UPI0033B4C84B
MTIPYGAGASGVLYRQEGHDGLLWAGWDGETREVDVRDADPITSYSAAYYRTDYRTPPLWLAAGSDTIITDDPQGGQWGLRGTDLRTGESSGFTLPQGQMDVARAGRYILTESGSHGEYAYRLAEWNGGASVAVGDAVAIPPTASVYGAFAADDHTAVIKYVVAGTYSFGLIDLVDGTFTAGPALADAGPTQVVLTPDRLAWLASDGDVRWVPRDNMSATPVVIDLTPPTTYAVPYIGAAGNALLVTWYEPSGNDVFYPLGFPLQSVSFTGEAPQTLLAHVAPVMAGAPDGSLVVAGGADSGQWAFRRVEPGSLAATTVRSIAPVAGQIDRVSLANGVLATYEADSTNRPAYYRRTVTTRPGGLTLTGPELLDISYDKHFVGPFSSGDGHSIQLYREAPGWTSVSSVDDDGDPRWFRMYSDLDSLVDLTGRYVIINGVNPVLQYVGDLGGYDTNPLSRPVRAASVWGTKLWSTTSSPGVLTAQDLKTKKITRTINTGLPCVFKELQAVGRWIYWSCGPTGQAGVWDLTTGKSIDVPRGEALIGDGYLVQHDKGAGKLMLTGFQDGTADDTHAIGDLPGTAERGVTWTVDKFGGPVAYLAGDKRVYVVPTGVPNQPVAPIESEVGTSVAVGGEAWKARWLMSRPVASWQIVIRNKATGVVVRTMAGSPNAGGGSVSTTWNGRTDTGGYPPNGAYSWTMTVKPADGQGPDASASGTLNLTGGAAVPRDFVKRDGFGDLLAFTSAGFADFRAGTGAGSVDAKVSGPGWTGANTVTSAVPFDDVSGDRCNDVLVRVSSGELRAYEPACGGALKSTTAYTKVGAGWNVYDVLTSPGDLTGDGQADLLAREKSTGYLYLYESKGDGVFKSRVKIGTGWKGYLLAGAGDLNGDGKGDLLARDTAGVLWRYAGTGKGTLGTRVKVGGGWQIYNSLVGVADVSGDGNADLLARDTSGVLWSYRGDGKGLFAARMKVGGGWQMYKILS